MVTTVGNELSTALRLFASVFESDVDRRLLDELRSRREELSNVLGGDALEAVPSDDTAAALEALAVEYCQLFIGPRGHMAPVESIVRGEKRYWGPSTERVADFYRSAGLAPMSEMHLLPDHLSMELDCLATLEEQGGGDQASIFAREHVLRWLPKLTRHVVGHAALAFYPAWCRGLQRLLSQLYGSER